MSDRRFPVHWGQITRKEEAEWQRLGCPRNVPWEMLAVHEETALDNHDQSLETLARRGGLGPFEMVCVLQDRKMRPTPEAADIVSIPTLIAAITAWQASRGVPCTYCNRTECPIACGAHTMAAVENCRTALAARFRDFEVAIDAQEAAEAAGSHARQDGHPREPNPYEGKEVFAFAYDRGWFTVDQSIKLAKIERELRLELWSNHGCELIARYGDDGEMQCGSCLVDFKRQPIEALIKIVDEMRLVKVARVLQEK